MGGPLLPAIKEAALESFGSMIVLVWLAFRNANRTEALCDELVVKHSTGWIIMSALVVTTFVATLGRGFEFIY